MPTKPSVESARVGHLSRNAHYAKLVSSPSLFQQILALKAKQEIQIMGDGLTHEAFTTHFNQLLDMVKSNPWTNGCLHEVHWDDMKILFKNGVEIIYK